MRRLVTLIVASVGVAACVSTPASTTSTSTPASSVPQTATSVPQPSCGTAEEFSDDGELFSIGGDKGDATRVSALNGIHDQDCDRFVIGLSTDAGAPATSVGRTTVTFLRDLGVVRVFLPDVTDTNITDGVFELPLIDRAYVVRSVDGSLYIDAHLAAGAVARSSVTRSPAQIIVELAPGGPDLAVAPSHSDLVVVLTPREGKTGYPLIVTGYARTFEANVVIRIIKGNSVAEQRITTATDYLSAWGEFAVTINTGPQGKVQLTVGDDADQDVAISLVLN